MEDILTTLARQFLPQMEPEEKAEALRSLKRMIDEEFCNMAIGDQPERTENSCPRCGSWHVVKKGREPDGSQRYLCRSCTRTFTSRTNKVFATTKLDRATWMRFAECHVDVLPLRECAERCGVSLQKAAEEARRAPARSELFGRARDQPGERPAQPHRRVHRRVPRRGDPALVELPRLVQVDLELQARAHRRASREPGGQAGRRQSPQDDLAQLQEDPVPVLRLLGQTGEMGPHGEGGAAAGHGGHVRSGLTCP